MLARWLVAFAISLAACAGNPDYGCAKPLIVGLTDFGVLSFLDDAHRPAGVDPDVLAEISRRTGCRMETQWLSRPILMATVQAGKIAIAGATAATPEREATMDVVVYAQSRDEFLLARKWSGAVKLPADLLAQSDITVGVIMGAVYGQPYDSLFAELRKQGRLAEAPDTTTQFRWLKLGRVEAAIGHTFQYQREVAQLGLKDEIVVRRWAQNQPALRGGLALSRKYFSETQLRNWEALIADMRHDGAITRILSHYLDADTVRAITVPD